MTTPTFTRFAATARAIIAADGAAAEMQGVINASGDVVIFTAVPTINVDSFAKIEGAFLASADGTIQLRAGTDTGTTPVIVRQGSYGILTPLN